MILFTGLSFNKHLSLVYAAARLRATSLITNLGLTPQALCFRHASRALIQLPPLRGLRILFGVTGSRPALYAGTESNNELSSHQGDFLQPEKRG